MSKNSLTEFGIHHRLESRAWTWIRIWVKNTCWPNSDSTVMDGMTVWWYSKSSSLAPTFGRVAPLIKAAQQPQKRASITGVFPERIFSKGTFLVHLCSRRVDVDSVEEFPIIFFCVVLVLAQQEALQWIGDRHNNVILPGEVERSGKCGGRGQNGLKNHSTLIGNYRMYISSVYDQRSIQEKLCP